MATVTWYWLDDNGWKEYNSATSAKLEKGYTAKLKEIPVDQQRFVYICPVDELRKNFLKLPADVDKAIGMQRRYDDETKRRIVKREVPQFFSDDTFHFAGLDKKAIDELTDVVNMYGGLVSGALTDKVTIIIMEKDDSATYEKIKGKAHDWNIEIVHDEFVFECVNQGKRVKADDFIVKPKPKPKKEEKREKRGEKKANGGGRNHKRGRDSSSSDESDNEKAKKQQKNDEKQAVAPAAPVPNVPPPVVGVPIAPNNGVGEKKDPPALVLAPGIKFMGLCSYISTNEYFPQLITIESVNGVNFEGRVKWPTLNDAETKMKGKCEGSSFTFEEYEIVKGVDDVEVPTSYSGEITGTSVIGKIVGKQEEITIKLDLIPGPKLPPPAAPIAPPPPAGPVIAKEILEALKPGSALSGTLNISLKCTIRIEAPDIAIIEWPSAVGGYHSRARLNANGSSLSIDEYEVIADNKIGTPSHACPRNYKLEGKFDADPSVLVGKAFIGSEVVAAAAAVPNPPAIELGDFHLNLK